MIRRIEALNYRCLRYIAQPISNFHVLVGPNASGKTTFLDVVGFLGQLLSIGLDKTSTARAQSFSDLVWGRTDGCIELAINADIPEDKRVTDQGKPYTQIRYEVRIGLHEATGELSILEEKVVLLRDPVPGKTVQRRIFPQAAEAVSTLILKSVGKNTRTVVKKVSGGNDNFYAESGKGWAPAFKLGPRKSAFANLPDDESKFPAAAWLKKVLMDGVHHLVLNSAVMRESSPPGQPKSFLPDGSNLPWVVDNLLRESPERFREWIAHLRTALPDLRDIRTREFPDNKRKYLLVCYDNGFEIPSWLVSDGTLRLLALTLVAYLPGLSGIYVIEEPENGIHPRAIETVFQSLSSVYEAQVLMATHSPTILGMAQLDDILCFAKTTDGATDIVKGTEHPALKKWRGEANLGVLFAGGVLG